MNAVDTSSALRDLIAQITAALIDVRQQRRTTGDELNPNEENEVARETARRFFDQRVTQSLLTGSDTPSFDDETSITKGAIDAVLGFGPLQRLLDDPAITDIHVRGTSPVWVKHTDGSRHEINPIVSTDDELIRLVRNVASRSRNGERRFDAATAECNLCLDDGSRLFAVMDVSQQPSLVIRKHQFHLSSLEELTRGGLMTPNLRNFLRAAVLAKRNIIVAGGTGSGKTTLLRALMNEIPFHERIITIEDAFEIGLVRFSQLHPDHDALQSRAANIEGHGAIPLADLTRMALRMDPDRVVVGEVRGAEAFPMLMAMSQGNNGSMCTLHADSTRSAFSKLAAYVSMANTGLPIDVVNLLLANALHLVIHIEIVNGQRRISSIREVVDCDGPRIVSNELFVANGNGLAEAAYPMTSDLRELLAVHGYDDSVNAPLQTAGAWR
ncbi:MAG: ATPase, T2SS/T4P/T4SS family [Actinomycetes bacterium]